MHKASAVSALETVAFAAMLAMASTAGAQSLPSTLGSNILPIANAKYSFSFRQLCGSIQTNQQNQQISYLNATLFNSGEGKVTLDTLHSYAAWLANGSSSAGLGSDPTNRTSPAQLGFTSTASRVAETVLQWGKIDDVVFSTGFANFGLANYVVPGPQYFIVTKYSFPSPQDSFTTGYLLYIWFPGVSVGGQSLPPAWQQNRMTVSPRGFLSTTGLSSYGCVVQEDFFP
ncbi:MAG: hypothetical protein HYS63_00015 [Methylocystis sp.]|nr:hypothetical protein [Methylocystis sp.]